MLENLIEKYKVVNSVGNNIGRIKDFFIDLTSWRIKAFSVSPSLIKKDLLVHTKDISKIDHDEKLIVLRDSYEAQESPSHPITDMYSFHDLKKHHVVDRNGEKVGKIYHLEVPIEKLKNFKVWKVLIKVGFKERRLRISPREITDVVGDVKLRGTIESYTEDLSD